MARSNGPFGPAGTRPPPRRHDDPFAAPPPGQSAGHWPPAQHAPQQGQGYHFPPEPSPNFGYQQQEPPASFDNYQGAPQHDPYANQQNWGQQDPRAYDLGNYMPNGSQQPYPPGDPPPFAQAPHHDPYAQQGYADPELDYEHEFAEDEEPGRGRRWMFIVAALVGAVGVGGALAYTYKSFVAPNGGRVPLVKAEPNVKVRPDGRTATPNDKRLHGRLGEDAGQQANVAAATPETQDDRNANDEPGGPRRVRTIPITPGGGPPGIQIAPPAQAAAPPSVPGIMLENVGPRNQPPPRVAPQQPPQQRVTIGRPPPPAPPQAREEQPPAPAKRTPAPPAQVAKAQPPAPPRAAPRPAANTGAGYVAVLSSQKSRMDALKVFADLQQKYSNALSGRVPDVQEADLSARGLGTVYRLVIGPPSSRDAASSFCSQVKAAGHKDCWVTSY